MSPDTESRTCLVLMPSTGVDTNQLYSSEIRPAIESIGLMAIRIDEIAGEQSLTSAIWQAIKNASYVVADLRGRHPFVFYELGIAQSQGKPLLLITESAEDTPFDLRHLRTFRYDIERSDPGLLKRWISESLREMDAHTSQSSDTSISDHNALPEISETQQRLASSLIQNSDADRKIGNLSNALKHLQEAVQIYRETYRQRQDHGSSLASALNNLGTLYQEVGDFSSALSAHQEAADILRREGDAQGEGAVLGNLANVFEARGDYERAEEFYRRALALSDQLGDESTAARVGERVN